MSQREDGRPKPHALLTQTAEGGERVNYRLFPQCGRLGGLFFLLFLLTLVLPQWGEAQFTTSPVLVASSPSGQSIGNAKLAIDATGTIHVAWMQWVGDPGTSATIMYSRSTDEGMSFSSPVPVAGGAPELALESLAVDRGGIIYLAGTSFDILSAARTVFLRVSRDGGQSFPFVTTFGPGEVPRLAVDGAANVNVAWRGAPVGGLTFSRSVDQGFTFSLPKTIPCGDVPCLGGIPFIGADVGGLIYILSASCQAIHCNLSCNFLNSFTRSTDGGATFAPATDLRQIAGCGEASRLLVEASRAIDVLFNSGNFSRSIDEGQTFSAPTQVPLGSGLFIADAVGNITVLGFVSGSPTRDIGVTDQSTTELPSVPLCRSCRIPWPS